MKRYQVVFMLLFCGSLFAQTATSVKIIPASANVISGKTVQFNAVVTDSPNQRVSWYSCLANAVNQDGLFTAPIVTKQTKYCIYVISFNDPNKSATASVTVLPVPKTVAAPPKDTKEK